MTEGVGMDEKVRAMWEGRVEEVFRGVAGRNNSTRTMGLSPKRTRTGTSFTL
jgi:hypothetical protein